MSINDVIAEIVEYDISIFKQMSTSDKIEFVESLLTEKYEAMPQNDVNELYQVLKGE
jgi:allophanate hydrolase subunit 2